MPAFAAGAKRDLFGHVLLYYYFEHFLTADARLASLPLGARWERCRVCLLARSLRLFAPPDGALDGL